MGLAFIGFGDNESAATSFWVHGHKELPRQFCALFKVRPRSRHCYGGNLAIVVVQLCVRIRYSDVIGSPTTLRTKPLSSCGIP
jgi:hypothetical protein